MPVGPVGRVSHKIGQEGRATTETVDPVGDRQMSQGLVLQRREPLIRIDLERRELGDRLFVAVRGEDRLGHVDEVAQQPGELEDPAVVPVVLKRQLVGRHRDARGEVGRTLRRGEVLGDRAVRLAEGAHAAVRARDPGSPLDGVVSVLGLVDEGIPLALGREAPTGVLDDDEVAVRREVPRFAEVRGEVVVPLAVRRAPQEHRDGLGGGGPVHVRVQRHAIARAHGDVVLAHDRERAGLVLNVI
jgi:hypothetical protein